MRTSPTLIPIGLDALREGYKELAQDYAIAYQELQTLRRLAFGQRKESLNLISDLQTRMDGVLGSEHEIEAKTIAIPEHHRKASRKATQSESITVLHDIAEADKQCPCGEKMEKVGESHTLIREIVPATCRHEDHVYPRYVCKVCQDEPRCSHESASPFEAQGVGAGVAAQILIGKHDDHLPFNRQEKILERQGIILSKSHMVAITAHAHDLVKGILEPVRLEVLESGLVGMDETTVSVLDEKLKGMSHRGYFWTMGSKSAVIYRFDPGRSGKNIDALLGENYTGYLVADGFTAYDPKTKPRSYTLVHCWAHVRRKFFELKKDHPLAQEAVNKIAVIFHLESEARKCPNPLEALAEARRTHIGPLVNQFWIWLNVRSEFVLPKSSLGQVINYALERKALLEKFLDDPRIPMDNNQSERDLRHVVIGRKNWNFAGSYEGAERMAPFFTLIQGCKRVGPNPWTYLTHVFSVIEDYSSHRWNELTPSRVKALLQSTTP
jgi:transposase